MNENTIYSEPKRDVVVIDLDARNLEPPHPLIKTLEVLATLPEGAALRLRTRWRPAHLYAELEKRGFVGQSEEQTDGSYFTYIRRG
jgi:TusA-related sulfurtransferase